MEICCGCWCLVNLLKTCPNYSWWLGFASLHSCQVHMLFRNHLLFHPIKFGLHGLMFCILQQKDFFFSRYPHVTCPVGVYLLGKLLCGVWVESWMWLQQFCSIALAKTLNMFWLWEEKERNTEVMVVIILLWEFSLWLEDYLVAYAKWNSCSGRQKSK